MKKLRTGLKRAGKATKATALFLKEIGKRALSNDYVLKKHGLRKK